MTSADGARSQDVVFILIPTILIVQNPGRNDVTEMPTLGGNLTIYIRAGDSADIIPVAQFSNTMFDAGTGHIRMTGILMTLGTPGNIINTLEGYTNTKSIKARFSNSIRGDLGLLEVQKVENKKPRDSYFANAFLPKLQVFIPNIA